MPDLLCLFSPAFSAPYFCLTVPNVPSTTRLRWCISLSCAAVIFSWVGDSVFCLTGMMLFFDIYSQLALFMYMRFWRIPFWGADRKRSW